MNLIVLVVAGPFLLILANDIFKKLESPIALSVWGCVFYFLVQVMTKVLLDKGFGVEHVGRRRTWVNLVVDEFITRWIFDLCCRVSYFYMGMPHLAASLFEAVALDPTQDLVIAGFLKPSIAHMAFHFLLGLLMSCLRPIWEFIPQLLSFIIFGILLSLANYFISLANDLISPANYLLSWLPPPNTVRGFYYDTLFRVYHILFWYQPAFVEPMTLLQDPATGTWSFTPVSVLETPRGDVPIDPQIEDPIILLQDPETGTWSFTSARAPRPADLPVEAVTAVVNEQPSLGEDPVPSDNVSAESVKAEDVRVDSEEDNEEDNEGLVNRDTPVNSEEVEEPKNTNPAAQNQSGPEL